MTLKEKWFGFRWGILNFLIVTNTRGHFGDVHIAVNYATLHPFLMPYVQDIVYLKAIKILKQGSKKITKLIYAPKSYDSL